MIAFIIGGSGSGKSEYAENLAVMLEPNTKIYIATMYPWDEESKERIRKHRKMREKKKFETMECFYGLEKGVESFGKDTKEQTVFLDCMSNLLANEMYCEEGYVCKTNDNDHVSDHILKGIDALCQKFQNVVIVSNDVFSDGVEYDKEMKTYLSALGKINERIAKRADVVAEVICNIPLFHKGKNQVEELMECLRTTKEEKDEHAL